VPPGNPDAVMAQTGTEKKKKKVPNEGEKNSERPKILKFM
jgi:hypothetical protein